MEDVRIRKLVIDLKTQESVLQSISPKVISVREKIKAEISRIQKEINKLRSENGTPLNRTKGVENFIDKK